MEMVNSFCELISSTPTLHLYAIDRLNQSLVTFSDNQTLMHEAFIISFCELISSTPALQIHRQHPRPLPHPWQTSRISERSR
jgi:hypothetical protein